MADSLTDSTPSQGTPGKSTPAGILPVQPPRAPAPPPREWPVDSDPIEGTRRGALAWIESSAAHATTLLASRLPEPLLRPTLRGLARVARRFDRRHADAARAFLTQALDLSEGPEIERRVLLAYEHFFRVALEADRFLRRVPFERTFEHVELRLSERARELLDDPPSSFHITPHVGNWELSALVTARLGFQPLYAVAKPAKNAYLTRLMQRSRERFGIRLLPRRGAMQDAQRIMAAGGSLGMLLDQRARTRPVLAPFFGRMARCDRSVGVLIKRMARPLLITACYREDPRALRFSFHCTRVVEPDEVRQATPEQISALINAEFERLILARPEQYFWLHDRYRDTPFELAPRADQVSDRLGAAHAPRADSPPSAAHPSEERLANPSESHADNQAEHHR